MFDCCDLGYVTDFSNDNDQVMDLCEPADMLAMLLRILHTPPPPLPDPFDRQGDEYERQIRHDTHTVIPIPLLRLLFELADKYVLSETIVESLRTHLVAHSPRYPLQVSVFATERGWNAIAAEASKYLLHPPLSCYTLTDVNSIPTVGAYHKLVLLHALRINRLREVLLSEAIFPHGYGACTVHREATTALWERSRRIIAPRIEAGRGMSIN
jgi:hypothetical protein